MEYPNKTFVLDITKPTGFGGLRRHIIIVVAKNEIVAAQHLKDKLGFDGSANELIWLMDTNHPTLYDQTGNKQLTVQAKIMYNTTIMMGG